jgi:peptidoglycan-N-acetylglucosamine deacetylase
MTAAGTVAEARSYAATHGAAPFDTPDLLPGDPIDLAAVDLGQPSRRVVALTFDDGPDFNDGAIVATLARYQARATFFSIGAKVAAGAMSVRACLAAGHEVGNHGFDHPMMTDLAPAEQRRNLIETNAALIRLGDRPRWFRPPYGDFDDKVIGEARAAGLRTVVWTLDSRDWKDTADTDGIASRVGRLIKPGAVVLMHSTRPVSTRALPRILEAGASMGLRFVTMSAWHDAMAGLSTGR